MIVERFANYHIAVYGLYLAGGTTRRIETEDVAALCWKLAPARFSWKKYSDFPDKDIVRTALSDAKKVKNGKLVDGTGDERWILTPQGIRWIGQNELALEKFARGPTRSSIDLMRDAALQRVRAHSLYGRWKSGESASLKAYEAADLAELPADAPKHAVVQNLNEMTNAAILAGDSEIQEFVAWVIDGIGSSKA